VVGLALNPDYMTRYTVVRSRDFGLPQARHRVYITMIRKDIADEVVFDYVYHCITTVFPQVHSRATAHGIARVVKGFARSAGCACVSRVVSGVKGA